MTNSILKKKLELIQWLSSIETKATIEKIMAIRDQEVKEWTNGISQEEMESIDAGLSDIEKGNLKTHINVRKIYEKYL